MLPFTIPELEDAVRIGDVTKRPHPHLPYFIYNYSPEVQFAKKWDRVTENCRGLILDEHYQIIARPWKKFYNLGEVELPIQFNTPVEVMDKADGSLGILYPLASPVYSGHHEYAIATRGSFTSSQAKHATAVWKQRYDGLHPQAGYTFLFEIIYPSNRIVLDYGDQDELVLLGAVENETGYYLSPQVAKNMFYIYVNGKMQFTHWLGPVIKTFPFNTLSDALSNMDRKNAEGYVVRSHNFMVKLKQPDYLELHKLVTNLTAKTVWVKLRDGMTVQQICGMFPDEFQKFAEDFARPLQASYNERYFSVIEKYHKVADPLINRMASRKDFALEFQKHKDAKFFFQLLDGKDISVLVWNDVMPREGK